MNWLIWMVPACIRCRHYQPRKYEDLAKCTKWNTTRYANQMRDDETKCGVIGKWYDPKVQ